MSQKRFDGMPDFLVIGAGKSGTTSIDKYLNQHPDVFVPRRKEPNFFGYESIKEEDIGENPDDLAHFRNSVRTLHDYLAIFEEAAPHQKKGETSNTYLYHRQAPERILHYIPDAKLIAILRQPADRLYSRYMHLARENRTPSANFSDCLKEDSVWWKRNDLIPEGFYARHLKPFFDIFPSTNLQVFLYEDLKNDPVKVMQSIYEFIGVNPNFTPDVSLRYNESGIVRNRLLNKIYGQGGWISKALQIMLPGVYQKLKSDLSLKKRMQKLRRKNLEKRPIDPAVRRALTLNVYGEDIKKLQALIGRDLSHWLNL